MKCMNPKCDSEEFNMVYTYSLTDPEEEESFWVVCDDCEAGGPACDTTEEARSYFEDQPEEYAPKPNDNLKIRYWDEINSGLELEKDALKDFSTEVLNMEFSSEGSACKEAFDALREIGGGDQMVKAASVGTSLYEAFRESINRNIVDPTPLMEPVGYFKGKLLGIPFDMSKEREIKIPKPLTPGPTQIADSPTPAINLESFSDKCDCGASARRTATTIKCTNPECYHYKE